jgi:hypothetical protein
MAALWKLFVLLAVMVMPFGMSAVMAASVNHAPAAVTSQHCDDHGGQPAEKSSKQSADCAIACSMLIAAETRIEEPAPAVRLVPARPLAERGTGLHPDTATPPPKLS